MLRTFCFLTLVLSCSILLAQAQKMPQEMDKLGKSLVVAVNEGRQQEADVIADADSYLALCTDNAFTGGTYYAEAKHIKAMAAATSGNYSLAQQIMDEVITVRLDKNTLHNNGRIGDSYFDRSEYHSKLKNTDQAIDDMMAAADAYKKAKETANYATALCKLAQYYRLREAIGDAEREEECNRKAFVCAKKGSTCYFNTSAWMINKYNEQGASKKANKLFNKVAKTGEGEHPLRYADFLCLVSENEAKARFDTTAQTNAIAHANEAIAIYKRENSTHSRNYAYLLKNVGDCYFNQQDFEAALSFYELAQPLLLGIEGKGGKVYEGCLRQINATNVWLGKVDRVQDYLQKLEEQIIETSDTTSQTYANALVELSTGKAGIGIYNEAISWGERALQLFKAIGDAHQQVTMLYYLGGYYMHLGKYQIADSLNFVALQLSKKQPEYTKETANILHQKAVSYFNKGDFHQADETCQQALYLLRKSNHSASTTYASILCDRALFLYRLDSLNAAITYTREALELQTRILGPKHGNNVTPLFNLAIYHFHLGHMDSVAHYYHDAITLQTDLVRNNFSFQSSIQREHFWQRKNYLYKTAPLFASDPAKTPSPELLTDIYNAQLFTKGILLNSEIEFRKLLENSGDKDVLSKYDELEAKRNELHNLYEKQTGKDNNNIIKLENKIKQLNWDIVRKCKEYGDFTQNLSLTADSVRHCLHTNEAAIEFVETNVTLNNKPDQIYLALILRPEWETPHVCRLFCLSEMEKLGYPAGVPINILLNDTVYQNRIYNDGRLGKLVWGKLLNELEGVKHICFAPSGIFYQWGIEYMPFADEGIRISDTLNVSRLSSTKLLAQRRNKLVSFGDGEVVIFGGMDYDMSIGEMRKYKLGKEEVYEDFSAMLDAEQQTILSASDMPEELREANFSAIRNMTRQGEMTFGRLKGANEEAEAIERLLRSAGIKPTRYAAYGTEGAFKALRGRKISLLHIATHGFSFPVTEQNKPDIDWLKPYTYSSLPTDPLCYSGLVFAGCNQKTQNLRENFPTDIQDGILTAQEIALLNLQNLQITVLSACQTGNGILQEDGVFGVQRGFKKAGAKTLVMSLWSVNDDATQLMMTSFYKALLDGLPRKEALLKAQKAVREIYPQPHYWAPFIMLDDI